MITQIFKGIDYVEVDYASYLKLRYISQVLIKKIGHNG